MTAGARLEETLLKFGLIVQFSRSATRMIFFFQDFATKPLNLFGGINTIFLIVRIFRYFLKPRGLFGLGFQTCSNPRNVSLKLTRLISILRMVNAKSIVFLSKGPCLQPLYGISHKDH